MGGERHLVTRVNTQETVTTMTSPLYRKDEVARCIYTDRIAGRLGDFPELTQAVHEGDVATVSILCEQLFQLNSYPNIRPKPIATAA